MKTQWDEAGEKRFRQEFAIQLRFFLFFSMTRFSCVCKWSVIPGVREKDSLRADYSQFYSLFSQSTNDPAWRICLLCRLTFSIQTSLVVFASSLPVVVIVHHLIPHPPSLEIHHHKAWHDTPEQSVQRPLTRGMDDGIEERKGYGISFLSCFVSFVSLSPLL